MIHSPLKWVGGKFTILDTLISHLDCSNRFVEPFMGSLVVSMNVNAKELVLNDFNPDLVNFFVQTIDNPQFIMNYISPHFSCMTKEDFYSLRDKFNDTPRNTIERACLFLIMNKFAFNGVCRYNKKGIFNVPYSGHKSVSVPNLTSVSNKFHGKTISFHNLDFSDDVLYDGLKQDDVVYFDPPYLPSDDFISNFDNYTGEGFSLEQHKKLSKLAENLYSKGVRVVISNHDTKFTRELYSSASYMFSVPKRRNIASQNASRKIINELIVVYGKQIKPNTLF